MKTVVVGFGVLLLIYLLPVVGHAQNVSSWLNGNPGLSAPETVASGQLPESVAMTGNIPCSSRTFTTRPAIPPLQKAETASACAVATPLGMTASGGYSNIFKSDAKVFNSSGGPAIFYPVPGSNALIVIENTALGKRLQYFSQGLLAARRDYNSLTKELRLYLPGTPDWTLRDDAGKDLYVRPESMSFSANGRWMVVDSEFVAMLRVDLNTRQVIPFSAPYVYHLGLSVTPHTTIDDGGETVITTSDRGDIILTDITSCAKTPTSITGPVGCRRISYEAFLKSKVNGYYRVYQPRFVNESLVTLFISYNTTPSIRALAEYRLAPAGYSLQTDDYLALGDSYTSGEGTGDYFLGTDTNDNTCHLSPLSYPYLLGAQLGLNRYHSVACSGARIQDITQYAQKPRPPNNNSLGSLLPGLRTQLQYVRDQYPTVITVSISGNDIGFGDKQKQCLMPGTCFSSYEDRLELVREMNAQLPRLVDMLAQLRKAASPNTKIFVLGYPQPILAQGSCPANVLLNEEERLLISQVVDYLNQVISIAASRSGVVYVDVGQAFTGFRLCETTASLSAMNGLVLGNDLPFSFGPVGNESYHPNQRGHQLYAQVIRTHAAGFNVAMPSPNLTGQLPDENSGLELLAAPKSNRSVRQLEYDAAIAADRIAANSNLTIALEGSAHFLEPGSQVTIELHSEPIRLGTAIVKPDSSVTSIVTIPAEISDGFHTLHVLGHDVVGNAIDVYKTLYVGQSDIFSNLAQSAMLMVIGTPMKNEDQTQVSSDTTEDPKTIIPGVELDDEEQAAQASSAVLAKEDTSKPQPQTKPKGKIRRFLSAWWHNKKARWGTIIGLLVVVLGLLAYPTTRYSILNAVGVRSSASVTVIDKATQQPLKNVQVNLNNASGTTNGDGYVQLEKVRLGETTLVVTRRAFAPLEKPVTVGWGSNPLGQVVLEPKGLQYSFVVKDFLSGKPIEKVEATSGDASAFSDKDGKLVLTLDTTTDEPVDITLKAEGYRDEKLTETAETTTDKEIKMVAAQQQAFISKRSGKYDLYKIYADGSGEALVLSGTGSERDDIALVPQPVGNNVALVSTRDNQRSADGNLLSTLNVVNIANNKVTKLDSADRIQVVGWIENTLVYITVSDQTPNNGGKKQKLMSYNVDTSQKLDITTANYFNAVVVAGDKIYYAPATEASAQGTPTNPAAVGFFMSDASGTNIKRLFDQEVWNMVRTNYDTIVFSTGKDWYEYKLSGAQPSRLNGAPADQKTRIYTNNAANTQSLWVDQRDGKGVLLSYDIGAKQDKVLTGQSGLAYPVRWLNDSTAVFRISSATETADYVVSLNGGELKKIVNVTNTSGIDKWYYY